MTAPWERDEVVSAAMAAIGGHPASISMIECPPIGGGGVHGLACTVLAAVGPMLTPQPVRWKDVDLGRVFAVEIHGVVIHLVGDSWCTIDRRPHKSLRDLLLKYGSDRPHWFRDDNGWHEVAQ